MSPSNACSPKPSYNCDVTKIAANTPQSMLGLTHWVLWRYEHRQGKWTKVPYQANGKPAKSNDEKTWNSFEVVRSVLDPLSENYNDSFDGAGFMLHDSPFVGLDFDGVVDDGVPEPYVLNILSQLGDPYCEITPSGDGLRCFVECAALPAPGRKFPAQKEGVEKYGAEIYVGNEGGRYLTSTGEKFGGEGIPQVTPEQIAVGHFLVSKFADQKFRRMWMGDASDHQHDDSRLDIALLGKLYRTLGDDMDKALRFFNTSVPGHRPKWRERKDYRTRTVDKILSDTKTLPQHAYGVEPAALPPDFQPSYDTRKELQFHLPPSDNHSIGDYVVAPATGQSDGWFPLGSFSLAGGASGSSKTTAVYQMLIDQRMKIMFLDHATFGRSFIVVGVDRGDDSHARTMKRMRLGLETIPFYPVSDKLFDTAVAQAILDIIEKQNPLPEIVFVEGVDMMVTKPSDIHCVSAFAHDLSAIARRYHIAIIGSGGAPKMKEGQKYTLARDCFFGSVAWGRTTETLLTMTKIEKHKGRRRLHIELRNAPDEDFTMEFKDGLLVQIADEPESEGIVDDAQLDINWYKEQARLARTDPTKTWWTVLDFARGRCISESTARRHADHDLAKGHINEKPGKKGRGGGRLFCWVEKESNPIWKREHEQNPEEQYAAF